MQSVALLAKSALLGLSTNKLRCFSVGLQAAYTIAALIAIVRGSLNALFLLIPIFFLVWAFLIGRFYAGLTKLRDHAWTEFVPIIGVVLAFALLLGPPLVEDGRLWDVVQSWLASIAMLLVLFWVTKLHVKVSRDERIIIALMILIIVVVFAPVTQLLADKMDFPFHNQWVRDAMQAHSLAPPQSPTIPHFLYHSLLITVVAWLNVGVTPACIVLIEAFYVFLGVVVYFWLRAQINAPVTRRTSMLLAGATLILLQVSAVSLPTFAAENLYLGYVLPHVFHNPTIIILKPLAVLLFLCMTQIFNERAALTRLIPVSAILSVLCAMAKPNFTISFLPALCLSIVYCFARRQKVHWPLAMTIIISSLVILTLQAIPTFGGANGVSFSPFAFFWFHLDKNVPLMAARFFLSILFPLCVYILHFKRAVHDKTLNLAWMIFAVGAFYTYFLVETARPAHGNFTWSGQITVMVLFIASLAFWIRPRDGAVINLRSHKFYLCSFMLALHVVSGLVWHFVEATQPGIYW